MIRKTVSSIAGYICVSFELPSCLWADRITIVGDFNEWNESTTPMRQERDGIWRATIDLPQGQRYEFRYLIDGQWLSDNHADGFAVNNYGISNSVVRTDVPLHAIHGTDIQIREMPKAHGRNFRSTVAPQYNMRSTHRGVESESHRSHSIAESMHRVAA